MLRHLHSADEPTDRWLELIVAVLALLAGVGGVYLGGRGLLGYARGIRIEPTDPVASLVGLGGGLILLYLASRLLRGSRVRKSLLSQPVLLAGSLAALAGGAWSVRLGMKLQKSLGAQLRPASVLLAVGVMGLVL